VNMTKYFKRAANFESNIFLSEFEESFVMNSDDARFVQRESRRLRE
jgi:hypothetical protein